MSPISDSTAYIYVRSRIDKKKPTCSFYTDAKKVSATKYESYLSIQNSENIKINFAFENDSIYINSDKDEDYWALKYYCSGGGDLAGKYAKIDTPLDETNLDTTISQSLQAKE